MSAGQKNKTAQHGADFVWPLQFFASDGATPIDVTSIDFAMEIYDRQGGDTLIHTADTTGGEITRTDSTNGKIKIKIPQATIDAITSGNYYFYLFSDDGTDRLDEVRGSFVVLP